MLILTRRTGESIVIEIPQSVPSREPIRVTVVGLNGRQVRIGVDASPDIHIVRSELVEQGPSTNLRPVGAEPRPATWKTTLSLRAQPGDRFVVTQTTDSMAESTEATGTGSDHRRAGLE